MYVSKTIYLDIFSVWDGESPFLEVSLLYFNMAVVFSNETWLQKPRNASR